MRVYFCNILADLELSMSFWLKCCVESYKIIFTDQVALMNRRNDLQVCEFQRRNNRHYNENGCAHGSLRALSAADSCRST
jgi:hypothetical protein